MNYFITFQPNKYNASVKDLVINFKKGLKKYYRKFLGQRYNNHKDLQYKFNLDVSLGNNKNCSHPHLHIIADIPEDKCLDFMRYMVSYLRKSYPKLSPDCQPLLTELDKLRAGMYSLQQSVMMHNEKDFQTGKNIF